ncbi:hypothetical protein N473_24150 [Pseudoalteromonas luteoviolacea CPMOR-1]|uniref:Lipoprotein n=1 Tax=Pseudoalteromonas luteoviolacea CPMOR-1 TaxID=1365248 RepID=A0A167J6Z7_9GAMM|nr:hypothetical protein [Pseudoalteromonas luteoviolacea]KZN60582.1 hypothetical protein N473_24150 [Pseudoalteromonas luteoviolacea CPMOR-1]
MNNKLYAFLPVVAALTLAGCGSSSKEEPSPVVTEKPTPVIPPALKSIELKTVFEGCAGEEPKSNVNIVFHDALGAVVGQGASNAEGIFKGDIPAEAKHISIVDIDIKEGLQIKDGLQINGEVVTHMDIEDGLNLGTVSLHVPKSYQGCDVPAVSPCIELRVDYTEIQSVYPDYTVVNQRGNILGLHNSDNLDSVPGFTEIQSCGEHDAFQFALVSPDGTVAKAASVKPSQYFTSLTVKLVAEDFIYEGVAVDMANSEFEGESSITSYQKEEVDLEGAYPYKTIFSASTTAMQFIFPGLAEYHQYRAYLDEDIEIGEYAISSRHFSRSTITESGQFDFEAPIPLTNSIAADFLLGNVNNSFSFDYDFSNLDDRLRVVNWNFFPTNAAGESFEWSILSDTSGTIPEFQFGTLLDINSADFAVMENFEIMLWSHPNGPDGFKAYREFIRQHKYADFGKAEYKSFVQAMYSFRKL